MCGINHDRTQNRLLSEPNSLTRRLWRLPKARRLLHRISDNPQPAKDEASFGNKPVMKVEAGGKKFTCFRCGQEGHLANKCKFINADCGKKEHLAPVCRKGWAQAYWVGIGWLD